MSKSQTGHTWLWVSNIPEDVDLEEIINLFEKYGPVHNVDMAGSFSSIEFENASDALRAKRGLDCVDFRGKRLNVTWYRKTVADGRAPNLKGHNWWGAYPGQPRNKYRLIILNLPKGDVTIQELLSLAWEAGNSVVFLDLIPLYLDVPTMYPLTESEYDEYKQQRKKQKQKTTKSQSNSPNKKNSTQRDTTRKEYIIRKETTMKGIIEYAHYDDYKYAIDYIDGRKFKGNVLRILANKNYINLENEINKQMQIAQQNEYKLRNNNSNNTNSSSGGDHGHMQAQRERERENKQNNIQNDSRIRRVSSLQHAQQHALGTSSSATSSNVGVSSSGGGGAAAATGVGGGVPGGGRYQYNSVNPLNPAHMPVPTQHLTREQGMAMVQPRGGGGGRGRGRGQIPPPPAAAAAGGGPPRYGSVRGSNAYGRGQVQPKHYNPYS